MKLARQRSIVIVSGVTVLNLLLTGLLETSNEILTSGRLESRVLCIARKVLLDDLAVSLRRSRLGRDGRRKKMRRKLDSSLVDSDWFSLHRS
jgi:hypothetical protein